MTLLDRLLSEVATVRVPAVAARLSALLARFASSEAERFLESLRAAYAVAGRAGVQVIDRVVTRAARSLGVALSSLELATLRRLLLRVLESKP